jgi:hypothetical protein
MPPKKNSVTIGQQAKQCVPKTLSPPPALLRQPVNQSEPQTPQLNDISEKDTPYPINWRNPHFLA